MRLPLALTIATLFACRRDDHRPAPAASPPALPVAVSADALPAAALDAAPAALPARGGADDPLAEKLRHCPVAVDGAATVVRDLPDGVELAITASDPAAVDEIRRRASHLVAFTAGRATRGEHGGGAGGGFMQNCPVVTRDTSITVDDTPSGATLHVRPTGSLTATELRAETRRRHAAFTTP